MELRAQYGMEVVHLPPPTLTRHKLPLAFPPPKVLVEMPKATAAFGLPLETFYLMEAGFEAREPLKAMPAVFDASRQRAFVDFIDTAEDLVKRGISSPRRLGIMGGINGGLLVGAVLTQRPELSGAVVCQVPLLDMRRYHQLLAGAS